MINTLPKSLLPDPPHTATSQGSNAIRLRTCSTTHLRGARRLRSGTDYMRTDIIGYYSSLFKCLGWVRYGSSLVCLGTSTSSSWISRIGAQLSSQAGICGEDSWDDALRRRRDQNSAKTKTLKTATEPTTTVGANPINRVGIDVSASWLPGPAPCVL